MTIRQTLLDLLRKSEFSANELARQTGIPQPTISRFLQGKTDIRLTAVDKLAAHFGLVLVPGEAKPAKRKK